MKKKIRQVTVQTATSQGNQLVVTSSLRKENLVVVYTDRLLHDDDEVWIRKCFLYSSNKSLSNG